LLRRPANHPLAIFGRHSLSIFVAGTILAMAGQVILYVTEKDPAVGAAYVVVGIVLQFAYAYYLEHKRLDTANHRPAKTSVGVLPLPIRVERRR
jgi:hypothetical protein